MKVNTQEVWHVRYKSSTSTSLSTVKVLETTEKTVLLKSMEYTDLRGSRYEWPDVTFIEQVKESIDLICG